MIAMDMFLVGLGGGLGSLFRWSIGIFIGKKFHGNFPLATFLINISGAFIIGYLSTFFAVDWHQRYGGVLNSALITGVLGGYTTFSSMQLDAAKLVNTKQTVKACCYLILSAICGLLAALFGVWLAY